MAFNPLLEDDAQQGNATQQASADQQQTSQENKTEDPKANILKQIQGWNNKIFDALKIYMDAKKQAINNIQQLNQELVKLGGAPVMIKESMDDEINDERSFSSVLFESLSDTGSVDAMRNVLDRVFDSADVSFVPDVKRVRTYARRLVTAMNKLDGMSDKMEEISGQFKDIVTNGYSSYSDKEIERLCDEFRKEIGNNEFFKWLAEK